MNSRQRRKCKRFSERMFQMIWARAERPVLKLTLDKSQPDIGVRILTGQVEITRELMEFGVVNPPPPTLIPGRGQPG